MATKLVNDNKDFALPQEDVAVDLIEVAGQIKWFDIGKGYGFIDVDGNMDDVLLHVTVLREGGFQTAYEGARIVCEAAKRSRGLQAFRIISMDETTAVHPSQLPPSRTHVDVEPEYGPAKAVVKWFNRIRGFGFLDVAGEKGDVFIHMETLRRYGITELRPGQSVIVRYGKGSKGLMAADIRPEMGSHLPSSH